eukprot:TRINITY_DN63992_c0_g1_i1.p1 TRINITY_DN63992_c0_g1~~TRINITY_DN63992_c0_g1_i1.p1  ORF type:complete len:180 (+),score=41.67 TRINITY_DN63992_c0_g1_i1:159-698(+)
MCIRDRLGLQGQSGAILSRGDTYQETSTGYFPINYLNNNYTVLFEWDLADLEAYLWTSFQTDDISVDGTREVRAYTVVDGVVHSSGGEQLAYGEVHTYALQCFTRGTSMCQSVGDRYTCCMKPHGTNIVPVSYTHLRAHETPEHLVCRLLLEKKKNHDLTTSIFPTYNNNTSTTTTQLL